MPKIIVEGEGTFFAATGQRLTAGEYVTSDPRLIASAISVNLDWVTVESDDGYGITTAPEIPDETPVETVKVSEPTLAELSGPLSTSDFSGAQERASAANADRPVTPAPTNPEPQRGGRQ